MIARSVATVLICCAAMRAAEPIPDVATIRVDATQSAHNTIPRTIFGSFLEPIGNSTYNGLWAEILQNPSFEENLWSASNVARMLRDDPSLTRASQLGLPLPWHPLDARQGNRYEPRFGDAANSWRSLELLGLTGETVGVLQKVYLPTWRQLRYTGSLYVKHLSGPATVEISLRRDAKRDEVLGHASIDASSPQWTKFSFDLAVPSGSLQPLEQADFVISVQGDERVLIDQVSLMPVDNIDGLDPEMVEMARRMHTPLLRFGGNFTSAYHWRDGIGPRDKRVSMLNLSWGMPEYNQFGTDEFLHFCELIGAEPQVALNLGTGTPEEAADWVRYVNAHWRNHSGGLTWELGNELWGNWNAGYPKLEDLAARTLAFSQAVLSVDPRARLIATGQDPDAPPSWNAAELSDPPGTFDLLSTHFVVTTDRLAGTDQSPDFVTRSTFALPTELGRRLRAMHAQIDAAHRDPVHLAFTEWLFVCCDGHPANAPRYDNMGGAVAAGGFFNMLLRNADIVPVADMTGIIEFAGIWKKKARVYGAPAYYTFNLYSNSNSERTVQVETNSGTYDVTNGNGRLPNISSVPWLDVVATTSHDGRTLTLFCVSNHPEKDIAARIILNGFRADRTIVRSLHADSIYAVNSEAQPDAVVPHDDKLQVSGPEVTYTFPHESVTVIELHER